MEGNSHNQVKRQTHHYCCCNLLLLLSSSSLLLLVIVQVWLVVKGFYSKHFLVRKYIQVEVEASCPGEAIILNSAFVSFIQMINVLANDGHKIFEAVIFGSFLLSSPVLFVACVVYACYVLGFTALTGVCTYIIFIPIQVCMNNSWMDTFIIASV